jgi:peptidoglycan/LPS O-acetylase OafA/YrhL
MYLFHMIAVNAVRRLSLALGTSSPYIDFMGGTLLAAAIASFSYLVFESRILKLKDRLFRDDQAPGPPFVGQTPTA